MERGLWAIFSALNKEVLCISLNFLGDGRIENEESGSAMEGRLSDQAGLLTWWVGS